jgi:hypothetical protein
MHGWVDQNRHFRVPRSPYRLFAYEVESFLFFCIIFFVVYEIQQNQKNYDIDFKFFIIINIKIDQILVKV